MSAADRAVHARHPDIPQAALPFDDEVERVEKTQHRKKYVKPFAHAQCPVCPEERVAQRLDNGVLRWGLHYRSTIAGRTMPCSASDHVVTP